MLRPLKQRPAGAEETRHRRENGTGGGGEESFPEAQAAAVPAACNIAADGFLAASLAALANRELDRVRAEEALVAARSELGAWREGRVVMVATGGFGRA